MLGDMLITSLEINKVPEAEYFMYVCQINERCGVVLITKIALLNIWIIECHEKLTHLTPHLIPVSKYNIPEIK